MAVLRCRVGNQQGRAQWTKDGFALGKLLRHLFSLFFVSSNSVVWQWSEHSSSSSPSSSYTSPCRLWYKSAIIIMAILILPHKSMIPSVPTDVGVRLYVKKTSIVALDNFNLFWGLSASQKVHGSGQRPPKTTDLDTERVFSSESPIPVRYIVFIFYSPCRMVMQQEMMMLVVCPCSAHPAFYVERPSAFRGKRKKTRMSCA